MLFILYNCLISFTLLAVFALGAISFSDDLLSWIDKHWEEIRQRASQYSMSDFKQHAAQEMVALGAFALTIELTMFIKIIIIARIQGVERVMRVLFPLTNLLFMVFSLAILVVGLYFNYHTFYTRSLPIWSATYSLIVIAMFVGGLGAFGYYSWSDKGKLGHLSWYILALSLSAFVSLITGLSLILRTSSIKEAIGREWPEVLQRLKEAGYENVSESVFSQFIEVNLKYAGLFVIVFCLFLIMGLIPAIYKSITLRRGIQQQSQSFLMSGAPSQQQPNGFSRQMGDAFSRFRLNSDFNEVKEPGALSPKLKTGRNQMISPLESDIN